MKKLSVTLSLLALLMLAFSAVSAQTLRFTNKTDCNVQVQLFRLDPTNCTPICGFQSFPVAANTMAQLAYPSQCPNVVSLQGTYAIRVIDGVSSAIVGNGCGLSATAQYVNCLSNTTTLEMVGIQEAIIYE